MSDYSDDGLSSLLGHLSGKFSNGHKNEYILITGYEALSSLLVTINDYRIKYY